MDASILIKARPRDPHHAHAEHTPLRRRAVVSVGRRVVAAAGPAVRR